MMSLLAARKTVQFAAPTAPAADDSDSDSDEEKPDSILKKAMQLTTKHRLKQLIGDAVQLDRRNTLAFSHLAEDRNTMKQRRLNKIRSVGKKTVILPKLAELVRSADDKPIVKFRRMARAVLLLIQVCHVCKDVLFSGIRKEPWFALIDNLIAKSTIQQKRKAPRAFVTFVPNERRELVQLTFDVAEFNRDRRSEFILSDEIRAMMSVMPGYRTPNQVAEIIRMMKVVFPNFANYGLSTQKAIVQSSFYDKYKANRVIVKKGHQPDGLYFVLTGCLVEKHEGGKQPKLINAGEKFGEVDLLCGNRRRATVLTKVDSEILYLHRQDYRVIFDMSEDSNNPKNLDICRQHIVFQHFPMQRLVENPGTWSVINYKYGQLIALDGNELDWIYVIKSGEARVFKYLQPGNIDVKARRRKARAMVNSQSPFYRKKRILNFVEEREYIKSAYRPSTYRPATSAGRISARSAPPVSFRDDQKTPTLARSCTSLPATRQGPRRMSARNSFTQGADTRHDVTLPRLVLDDVGDNTHRDARATSTAKDKNPEAEFERVPLQVIVTQETVEELPENLTSRSTQVQAAKEGEGGAEASAPDSEQNDGRSKPDAENADGHETDRDEVFEEEGKTKEQDSLLGANLAADSGGNGDKNGTKRFMERRLSTDMTGKLFDKPVVAGQRRQSILVPPDEMPAVIAAATAAQRRISIVPPPPTATGKTAAPDGSKRTRGRSASFLKTPVPPGSCRSLSPNTRGDKGQQVIQVGNHTLPAFVQVETLHPGQVFGLRACLDPEERGPSVSLVSGDCEVLQINKKFFMRHCDDAIFSLIRLKNKPFPSEEDLIDRLDINMQWEEYKKQTLHGFLNECRSAKR